MLNFHLQNSNWIYISNWEFWNMYSKKLPFTKNLPVWFHFKLSANRKAFNIIFCGEFCSSFWPDIQISHAFRRPKIVRKSISIEHILFSCEWGFYLCLLNRNQNISKKDFLQIYYILSFTNKKNKEWNIEILERAKNYRNR